MSPQQLTGRYAQLQHELAIAYNQHPWPSHEIDRLADLLALTERQMIKLGAVVPGTVSSGDEGAGDHGEH